MLPRLSPIAISPLTLPLPIVLAKNKEAKESLLPLPYSPKQLTSILLELEDGVIVTLTPVTSRTDPVVVVEKKLVFTVCLT